MCYDMLCNYQDHMGDCIARSGFQKNVGVSPCFIGEGTTGEPGEEDWFEQRRHNLVFQYLMNQGRRYQSYGRERFP